MSAPRKLAPVYEMLRYRISTPTVLILDDQGTGRLVLAEVVKSIDQRMNIVMFSDPGEAVDYVRWMAVDLVITDFRMPRMDGIETIRQLRAAYTAEQLPIIMTTVVRTREVLYRAFEAGVSDYLVRPVDPIECRVRCENLLRQRTQYLVAEKNAETLNERIERLRVELAASGDESVRRLAVLASMRDTVLGGAGEALCTHAVTIARQLGCDEEEISSVEIGARIHDIGELVLPATPAASNQPLTPDEMALIRKHPETGYDLLKGSTSRFMQAAATVTLQHHERMDGSGYPYGLKGNDISKLARIVAVADVFTALTSPRPYRDAWNLARALDFMCSEMAEKLDQSGVVALADSIKRGQRSDKRNFPRVADDSAGEHV